MQAHSLAYDGRQHQHEGPVLGAPVVRVYGPSSTVPTSDKLMAPQLYPLMRPPQRQSHQSVPITKDMFLSVGLAVLLLLCLLPVWDCATLLLNPTFIIFGDRQLPVLVLAAVGGVVVLFYLATIMLVGRSQSEQRSAQTMSMICSLSMTLLGLVLVLVSLPLTREAMETHNGIIYQCGSSLGTRELHNRYMELVRLRMTPSCARQYSIEGCDGFSNEPVYTPFLKALEENFRCSGFCFPGLQGPWAPPNYTAVDGLGRRTALLQRRRAGKAEKAVLVVRNRKAAVTALEAHGAGGASYPPTLFSDANFRASCDGAAARNIMDTAFVAGSQMWYTGVVLIGLSVCTGLWEWSFRAEK